MFFFDNDDDNNLIGELLGELYPCNWGLGIELGDLIWFDENKYVPDDTNLYFFTKFWLKILPPSIPSVKRYKWILPIWDFLTKLYFLINVFVTPDQPL